VLPGAGFSGAALASPVLTSHSLLQTLAQSLEGQSLEDLRAITFRPPTPPDVGSPRERRGAASRGVSDAGCPAILDASAPHITALTPAYNTLTQALIEDITYGASALYGSTLEPYPTIWMYLPYELTPNRPGELRAEIMGADGFPIHQTLMTYTDVPAGIVGFPLAGTDFEPLEIGEWRDLIFVIQCDRTDTAKNLHVGFTVQRVAPPTHLDGSKGATRERAVALGEAGVWYDLLTTLAALRRTDRDNAALAAEWRRLLASVGLADVTAQPLSDCCTVPENLAVETETPE
jgi:hypothetical protein